LRTTDIDHIVHRIIGHWKEALWTAAWGSISEKSFIGPNYLRKVKINEFSITGVNQT
jgi:hypothetical protein